MALEIEDSDMSFNSFDSFDSFDSFKICFKILKRIKLWRGLPLCIVLLSCTQESDRELDFPMDPIQEVSFQTDIQPILQESCQLCHGEQVSLGAPPRTEFVDSGNVILWAGPIIDQLQQERMPPVGTSPLSGEDRQLLINWLEHQSSEVSAASSMPHRSHISEAPSTSLGHPMAEREAVNINPALPKRMDSSQRAGQGPSL
jgi:hypothetical protein